LSIASAIFFKYGSCIMTTNNFITRYFYLDDDLNEIEVTHLYAPRV